MLVFENVSSEKADKVGEVLEDAALKIAAILKLANGTSISMSMGAGGEDGPKVRESYRAVMLENDGFNPKENT